MILITGANGRPGSAVVHEFVRRGETVRALVRDAARALAAPGVEVVVGDMLEPETLSEALRGVDRVLMISSAGPLMLETQCTFIDAAKRAGVQHLVKFLRRGLGRGVRCRAVPLHPKPRTGAALPDGLGSGLDEPATEPVHAGVPSGPSVNWRGG